MGLTALAQQDNTTPQAPSTSEMKPQLMTLKCIVKADGDKYTFTNDADAKTWDLMNPATLKGHDGHHVQLSAHVYTDKNSIHVMSVKMQSRRTPPAQ
jgi:hypothetical protein